MHISLSFIPGSFIHTDMLARHIKQRELLKHKFYCRLEQKCNKTMDDKKNSSEEKEDIIKFSNIQI